MNNVNKLIKYRVQTHEGNMYRLTLSAEAFALAVLNSGDIAGFHAVSRLDGQWDVMVATETAKKLQAQRQDGEHLTNVVERTLAHTKVWRDASDA